MEKNVFERHEAEVLISDEENHHFVVRFAERSKSNPKRFVSNGYMKLIINYGTLIVVGDYGDAVYQWNEALTWEWLSDLDIDYFRGKCQASEYGRKYVDWDSDKAERFIEDELFHYASRVYDYDADYEDSLPWDKLSKVEKDNYLSLRLGEFGINKRTILEWTHSKEGLIYEFQNWEHSVEVFGDDYYEFYNCGEVTAYRCHLHLQACKEIHKQLSNIPQIIELKDYLDENTVVLSGRPLGEKIREKTNIDVLHTHRKLKIVIPENICSINPSFLEAFLENIVAKIGVSKVTLDLLMKHIEFENKSKANLDNVLVDVLYRIINQKSYEANI